VQPTDAPFTEQPGPKVPPSCETPEDCFSLFFDDNLLQYIVDQTNTYAQKKLAAMQVKIIVIHFCVMSKPTSLNVVDITPISIPELETRHQG
jgi:hypothetical protein